MTATMMILALAVLMCMAGAVAGNRIAWPLLAYAAVGVALRISKVEINFVAAVTVDLVVVIAIVLTWWWNMLEDKPMSRRRDLFVIALFLPIWFLWVMKPSWWGPAIELLVAVQLASVFPFRRAVASLRVFLARRRGEDNSPLERVLAWR